MSPVRTPLRMHLVHLGSYDQRGDPGSMRKSENNCYSLRCRQEDDNFIFISRGEVDHVCDQTVKICEDGCGLIMDGRVVPGNAIDKFVAARKRPPGWTAGISDVLES